MWRGTFSGLLTLSVLTGCQIPTGFVAPVSLAREAESLAGRRAASRLERIFGGTYADATMQTRMETIGKRLARDLPAANPTWRFSLLASDEVNAFSLPGGFIYLTRGLCDRMGDDDGLLAAAIAHEMSHVLSRDGLKTPTASDEESLQREFKADAEAVPLLRAGGFALDGLSRLMDLTADVQTRDWADSRKARLAAAVSSSFNGRESRGTGSKGRRR